MGTALARASSARHVSFWRTRHAGASLPDEVEDDDLFLSPAAAAAAGAATEACDW